MKKTINLYEYELPVVVEKDPHGGYVARCTIWKDCYAQGDSIEDVISEISTVATGLIELYKEEGLKIPLKLTKTARKSNTSFSLNFPVIVSTS